MVKDIITLGITKWTGDCKWAMSGATVKLEKLWAPTILFSVLWVSMYHIRLWWRLLPNYIYIRRGYSH